MYFCAIANIVERVGFVWNELSPACAVLVGLLSFTALASLFAAAFTEPGVLPHRRPLGVAPLQTAELALKAVMYREVSVSAASVIVKYCYSCRMWRPPRCSHCKTCNCCIGAHDTAFIM